MPRSRDPRSYSREYPASMLRAYRTGEHRLPPMPLKQARSERSKFYSYVQSVRKNPSDDLELTQAVWQVSFRLEGEFDGTGMAALVMYHKENTETARLLRAALGMKSSFDEAKEEEERLMAQFAPKPVEQDPMGKPFTYDASDEMPKDDLPPTQPTGNKYYTRQRGGQ